MQIINDLLLDVFTAVVTVQFSLAFLAGAQVDERATVSLFVLAQFAMQQRPDGLIREVFSLSEHLDHDAVDRVEQKSGKDKKEEIHGMKLRRKKRKEEVRQIQ